MKFENLYNYTNSKYQISSFWLNPLLILSYLFRQILNRISQTQYTIINKMDCYNNHLNILLKTHILDKQEILLIKLIISRHFRMKFLKNFSYSIINSYRCKISLNNRILINIVLNFLTYDIIIALEVFKIDFLKNNIFVLYNQNYISIIRGKKTSKVFCLLENIYKSKCHLQISTKIECHHPNTPESIISIIINKLRHNRSNKPYETLQKKKKNNS